MGRLTFDEAMHLIRLDDYRDIAIEYEKLIDLAIDTKWKKLAAPFSNDDEVFDYLEDEALSLRMFKYRMNLMSIVCLSETYEQDLYNFLKSQGYITTMDNQYAQIKSIFNASFPLQNIDNYTVIGEMRDLVNAIKHGNSRAFDKVRTNLGDSILLDSNIGIEDENGNVTKFKQHRYDENTLTSMTLNVQGKIDLYYKEIVKFWNDVFQELKNRNTTRR